MVEMKTLHIVIIGIFSLITSCAIFYVPTKSFAMYMGPDCNENSLLGFPLVSPYFTKKIAFVSNVGSADSSNFVLYTVNNDKSKNIHRIDNIVYPSTIAISSDGSKIAFFKHVDKTDQIFVADTDGSSSNQITYDNDSKSIIGITPDGKKIIYGVHYQNIGLIQSYVVSDGKNHVTITSDSMNKTWSALSYDGSTIVFNDDSRQPRIFSIRTDGSNFHYVTNGSLFSHTPVISANGSKIVFSRDNPDDSDSKYIYSVNTDGTDLIKITPKPIYSQSTFTISLDGSKVAFDDGRDNAYYVSVVNSDGTGYTRLNDYDSYYSHMPLLSSDGSKVIYSAGNPTQWLFITDLKNDNGSHLQVDSNTIGYEKEISPETAEIVYPKIVNKTEEIMAATPDGKTFQMFDNSAFVPNPNCTISNMGGPIEYHPASHPPQSFTVQPDDPYLNIKKVILEILVVVIVIGIGFIIFRRLREKGN
jgi:Tol biopolymer transport system component